MKKTNPFMEMIAKKKGAPKSMIKHEAAEMGAMKKGGVAKKAAKKMMSGGMAKKKSGKAC